MLALVDVVIVVVYVLGSLFLGAWFARRQAGLGSYFVGDRNVSWWLVLTSIVATETSTVTFLSVPGLAYRPGVGNLTFLQLALGYLIGRVLIAWLLMPLYFRGELLSAYQLLQRRFNVSVQRTASGVFLVTRSIADGLRLYLAALLLHQFTGWNAPAAVLVIGTVTVLYTYLGGMQAVLWTDLVQMLVYLTGAVAAAVFILHLIPGGPGEYLNVGRLDGKFVWFDPSLSPTLPYTIWAGLIGGAFFTMASHGADQMMVQRYLCSKSLTQARVALVLSGVVVLLQFLLFLLLGVGLYVLVRSGIMTVAEGTRSDEVFGQFIVHFLPHGLVGLLVAAVLAASMGTLASSLNSSSSAFVGDFYHPLRPGRAERHYLRVSKLMTVFFGVARVAVALAALGIQGDRSVVDQVLTVAGFTMGLVLGLFLLGRLPWPVTSRSALVGLVAGFVVVTAVWLPVYNTAGGAKGSLLAWPWLAPIGALTTVGVALVINPGSARRGPSGDGGTKPGVGTAR
jgi:SSS family transporter